MFAAQGSRDVLSCKMNEVSIDFGMTPMPMHQQQCCILLGLVRPWQELLPKVEPQARLLQGARRGMVFAWVLRWLAYGHFHAFIGTRWYNMVQLLNTALHRDAAGKYGGWNSNIGDFPILGVQVSSTNPNNPSGSESHLLLPLHRSILGCRHVIISKTNFVACWTPPAKTDLL